ncbi:MAG: NfeD family protein [Hyphomicrobium sp.]
MQQLTAILSTLGPWTWLILAAALFMLETVVPGVHFLWFGLAAVIVGALTFATGFGFPWQLVAFALISIATVFWVRRFATPENARSDLPDLNVRGAQYIGRKVVVEDAITNGRGKVRVGDTLWGAQGEDAPKGAQVEVVGVNGTMLVVERPDAE